MFETQSRDKWLSFAGSSSKPSSVREGSTTRKGCKVDHMSDKIDSGAKPAAVELEALKWAQTNAEAGDYFMIFKKGKERMPGVICDEEMINKFFKRNRPDGSYHKRFSPHGKYPGQKSYPFMYLDGLKIGYVSGNLLRPIDFSLIAQRQDDPNTKPSLKRAYSDLLYGYDLDYWKSALLAKSLSEENMVDSSDSAVDVDEGSSPEMHYGQKRKRTEFKGKGFRLSPTLRALEGDDEEDDDESRYFKGEHGGGATRHTFSGRLVDQDNGSLYSTSDTESRLDRAKIKKIRLSESVSRFTPPATPQKSKLKIVTGMVRIFVGNPHRDFIVKRDGLEQSELLRNSIKYESGAAYIMSPILADLLSAHFESVVEYLDHGEYKPNLLDESSDYARLERVETADQSFEAIVKCGRLYTMSARLELPGLQNLVIRKFMALRPYSAEDFLLITKLFYSVGQPSDRGLHDFVVSYAVEHFYELWSGASETFRDLLAFHPSLARDIFRKLGGLAKEEKAEVEEENEDEYKLARIRENGLLIKAEADEPFFLD
ncbi:hypothetical protein MMC26_001837 [Xylographa opegraphella]|nr:hypothetical protein [Xylographa opegraphella]